MITYNFLQLTEKYFKGLRKEDQALILGSQVMDYPGAQGVRGVDWLHENSYIYSPIDLDINGEADITCDLSKFQKTPESSDLSAALPLKLIADFGTMEHVEDLANGLRNLFAWLGQEGIQIHINPNREYFDGVHEHLPRLTVDFWRAYADYAGYVVFEAKDIAPYDATGEICSFAVLVKEVSKPPPSKKKIVSIIEQYAL